MRFIGPVAVSLCGLVWLTAAAAQAQQTTTSTETKTFEVIAVDGQTLVVRLPEGTRELTVPDDFRLIVNGQPVSVRELKPGMTGTATITTRTTVTPVTVTQVKDGTVVHVAGSTIMVRTAEGVRSFTQSEVDKRGVRIVREGKPAQLSAFRVGDRLSATIITTKPPTVVTEKEVQATLAASGPAAARPGAEIAGAAAAAGAAGAASAANTATGRRLPKTASPVPLLGLLALGLLSVGAALRIRRRRFAR